MKKMVIFDPAMCCSTGVCGPSVDPELLRVSTVINNLKNKGILVERYNPSGNPQIFVDNKEINRIINAQGIDVLPVTMVDGEIVKTGAYPTNLEFCNFLGISPEYIGAKVKKASSGCDCKGKCC